MNLSRRAVLEAGGVLSVAALAGCIDDSSADESGTSDRGANAGPRSAPRNESVPENASDPEPDSAPEFEDPDEYPDEVEAANGSETGLTDEEGYETYAVDGHEIPMAPTDDVHDWYTSDEEPVIVDARSAASYEEVHVRGAVSSPVAGDPATSDPLAGVSRDARIVTYCTCPRHLSGYRAAALAEEGYTDVYLLKAGLQDWAEQGYPLAGTAVN